MNGSTVVEFMNMMREKIIRHLGLQKNGVGRTGCRRPSIVAAACLSMAIFLAASPQGDQRIPGRRFPVPLAQLIGPRDSLDAQGLWFDARSAEEALAYLDSGNAELLSVLAGETATLHLLNHARQFDYAVPKDSPESLVRSLLAGESGQGEHAAICRKSLAYFSGPMLDDVHWVADSLRYLPTDFQFHGSLFLTFGYDIGVALAPSASLNGAHSHFTGHPRELVYYAIHELHHVGFQTYQPPPRIDSLKTCADVRRFVEYATQMEGMAVLAAYERRQAENALGDDADYVALQDEARMQSLEAEYFKVVEGVARRGDAAADAQARGVIEKMSGERLWYRVGARMAMAIEKALGRPALIDLVKQGPARFMETYRRLGPESEHGGTGQCR